MAATSLDVILRGGLGRWTERDPLVRPGLGLVIDPSAFILGEGALSFPAPGEAPLVIEGVGRLAESGRHEYRLYPEGSLGRRGDRFLSLAPAAVGAAVTCRWFARIAEERPGDTGAWIAPPRITAAGHDFERADATSARTLYERIVTGGATIARTHQLQLYGRPTGLQPPAPPTEHLAAARISQGAEAWVALHAGIDLNPAGLVLA